MEPTPWWINYTNNLILWTALFTHDWRHDLLRLASVELEFASIYNSFVQLHILPCVLDRLLDDVDTYHFLGILAEANSYGTRTTTNVEQSCCIVDLREVCDQGQHFLENSSVNLEERKRGHSESEATEHFFIVSSSAQDFPFISFLVSTAQVRGIDHRQRADLVALVSDTGTLSELRNDCVF